MVRILIRAVVFLASAALGLWVASLVLEAFVLSLQGFLVTIVVFAAAQSVLSPFIAKVTARSAPAFLGGVGLVATFVALLLATLIGDGLVISGWQTWILATLIVWLVTALATVLLPLLFVRKAIDRSRAPAGRRARVRRPVCVRSAAAGLRPQSGGWSAPVVRRPVCARSPAAGLRP